MSDKPFTTTGLARILRACRYSADGLRAAWSDEAAFRQESVLVVLAVLGMLFLPLPLHASWMLLASALLVLVVELMNSAVEAVVDLASPALHPLAKKAKDCGSAAVTLSLLILVLVWAHLLLPLVI